MFYFRKFLGTSIAAIGVIIVAIGTIAGGTWGQCELEELLASDDTAFNNFANSVAISGNVAVVGSSLDDDNGDDAGAAYVYRYDGSGWNEEFKLLAFDGIGGEQFGYSVAVSGDVALVGAWKDDDLGVASGSAYVYRYNGSAWLQETKLLAFEGASTDRFGTSVAISDDIAIVGADDGGGPNGYACVFRFDGSRWIQEDKLIPSDGPSGMFGTSVTTTGLIAIVGAFNDDDNGLQSGSAYVFGYDGSTWVEEAKLLASDGEASDFFGASVAASGNVVIVGAYSHGHNNGTGSAYMYRYDGATWIEEIELLPSAGGGGDQFGGGVAIDGDVAIVGARFDDTNGVETGAAYRYYFDGFSWGNQVKLVPSDGAAGDQFGFSVAVSGDFAIIAAAGHEHKDIYSGSAYVFVGVIVVDCNNNGIEDICDILLGISEDCNGNGVPDECDIADQTSADCNGNGVPDECDVADQTSADCNGNGVPDECDVADQTSADCNGNGVPDECDVADGTSEDCDGDEVPDDCQILYFVEVSPPLGPIGDGSPQTYVLIDPPEVSPQPGTQVLVSLTASADLGSATEWIDVFLNDQFIGTVFEKDGNDCADPPDEAQLVLGGDVYSEIVAGGDAEFQFVASFAVDAELCQDSFVTVQVEYQAVTDDDCNGNAIPDICDILFGGFADKNGNWIPDECEDTCLWDLDGSGSVGATDLLSLLVTWGPCDDCDDCPADFDGNCSVGATDLLALLVNWGPCP